jgi:hypothetical protein
MHSSTYHVRDPVMRRCSSSECCFKHVEIKRPERLPACAAKNKKQNGKQRKQASQDVVPSMPDTASLHLQYARMLDLDPTVAMKRVIEGACPRSV